MSLNAKYQILKRNSKYILIKDLCDGTCRSVTNDANHVIDELCSKTISYSSGYVKHRRIFYCDTEGEIDELDWRIGANGLAEFIGFKPGHDGVVFWNG